LIVCHSSLKSRLAVTTIKTRSFIMAEEKNIDAAVDTTVAPEAAPAAQEGPSIGLADLQNAVKVIDYAAEQGAFKGWAVIEQVIAVRNKINTFVVASLPAEEAKAEEAAPAKKAAAKAPAKKAAAPAAPAKAAKTVKKVK
jgi:hypothetical protein